MTERINILTPVGRLVMGDCFKAETKDAEGNPLTIKSGPNIGQPRVKYFIAVAVPKTDPGLAALQTVIMTEARRAFPALFDAAGNCTNPAFAYKMVDGDSVVPNMNGVKPCDREGFPGHVIFYFSTSFATDCYTKGGAEKIIDPEAIKRGYYVRVNGSVSGNNSQQQPGVYLNHNMVELVGYGAEINTGPDGATVFGGQPAGALPAGASVTPVAGVPLAVPGAVAPVAAPPAAVAPAHDFLTPPAAAEYGRAVGAGPPVAPGEAVPYATTTAPAPPAAPPAEIRRTAADGVGYTAGQLLAAGYTQAQIDALPVAP